MEYFSYGYCFLLSFAYPSLILRLSFAYHSSHTRLRQLADFPSLILVWRNLTTND
ncbi:hypothetical protein HMPREF9075_00327 [Capnocytophaga sp. oral taxon 332 str. F0381]|uniref:hypothetical protein n=1 Tax=Capnocytophaga sp. oral taxon 332 TaxID=712213 RepID=UPI0002A2C5D3|nr:hypothetical protein [Capnocytophaga sp. oral taxon 332]EKY12387.1 hypothetical protein HMPREF9075_00327 [Capnocytophaga sp. oral taxon 332 str. F0381]